MLYKNIVFISGVSALSQGNGAVNSQELCMTACQADPSGWDVKSAIWDWKPEPCKGVYKNDKNPGEGFKDEYKFTEFSIVL